MVILIVHVNIDASRRNAPGRTELAVTTASRAPLGDECPRAVKLLFSPLDLAQVRRLQVQPFDRNLLKS
jgi:hypothetical protein